MTLLVILIVEVYTCFFYLSEDKFLLGTYILSRKSKFGSSDSHLGSPNYWTWETQPFFFHWLDSLLAILIMYSVPELSN